MFGALQVPDFPLQCILRVEPELRACAVAALDAQTPSRVRHLTRIAEEQGVVLGMTATQALGRCPSLLLRQAGAALLEPATACLLQVAETESPWLEATGEGVVTLEWRGPAAVPAAAESSAWRLVERLEGLDFAARAGVAETPDLAWLAAQRADPVRRVAAPEEFLSHLPCSVLALESCALPLTAAARAATAERTAVLQRLELWGIRTLGELAALPRDEAVVRLGASAAELWDRAAGRVQRLLRLTRAPEVFAETRELENPVETLEPLLFILRRFLEQILARLAASYRVAATLTLELRFASGPPHGRNLLIPSPTGEIEVLFRILTTHLESIRAPAPIVAVTLSATAVRQEQKQFDFFVNGLRDPNKFFETLGRLQALFGRERVGTPVLEDTRRPDAFHLETPRFDEAPAASANGLIAPLPQGPPLLRYRPPLPANVQVEEGRPRRVFSEKAFGEITDCRGPWEGSGEWWDGRAWERHEWDVQVGGVIYRLAEQDRTWFVDGAYD